MDCSYTKKINVFSVILSQLIIMIPISLLLNSWLMSILFNANFQAIFWSRLFRNLALIPIQIIIIMVVFTALEKRGLFKTFKLWTKRLAKKNLWQVFLFMLVGLLDDRSSPLAKRKFFSKGLKHSTIALEAHILAYKRF